VSLRIAILGGTSHIARALTHCFLQKETELTLFARSPEKLPSLPCRIIKGFESFPSGEFDLVINCIGAGTPKELKDDYNRWFSVLEKFDNLALDYLKNINPQALYVMFSSGAVYGRQSGKPATEDSSWNFFPNRLSVPDYYAISKIYSEAKHRSLPQLRIADLRIFSFFSRYIDLDSGYFMTDLVRSLVQKRVFETAPGDMFRDFPHPEDLAELILNCAAVPQINTAIDVASKSPVSKQEILKLYTEHFGLHYQFSSLQATHSPNGNVNIYLPTGTMAEKSLNWQARYTSIETLISETEIILKHYGKA